MPEYQDTFDVDAELVIIKAKTELQRLPIRNLIEPQIVDYGFKYEIELATRAIQEVNDPQVELARDNEIGKLKTTGITPTELYPIQSTSLTYGVADSADGICFPVVGKQYSMAAPAGPGSETEVLTWYEVSPANAIVTISQLPDDTSPAPFPAWEACVESPGGGWSPTGNITVTVYWQYYTT